MASTAEGLSVGSEEGLDPNNSADFAKIMEGRGVAKVEGDESTVDRSIASGLTEAGPEQQPERDKDTGRFVSNQEKTAAQVAPAAATDTSGEEVTGDLADPAVQEFLKKYDGNVAEALRGAASAQALIGRRDEKTEAMERELAELRGVTQGLLAGREQQAAPTAALSAEEIAGVAATRVEALGFQGAATEAANVSAKTGDERPLQAVIEQWALESQFAAMDFLTDFRLWQREQAKPQEPEQPAWMQTAAEQVAVNALEAVITSVAAERGVPQDSPIIEHMMSALEAMPKNVLDMVGSDDPESAAAGVRIVMDRATLMAGAAVAAAPPAESAPSASVARKLAGAAVASGALRPTPEAPSSPTNREDAIKEFKRAIVEAPTTSISSGLTYGPTP